MDDEFQMSDGSAHKTPRGAPRGGATDDHHQYTAMIRDTEQRCAKLLADAECKVLEERLRGQERETALREELARERGREKSTASFRGDEVTRVIDENKRMDQQMRDLQKQLAESEGRFQVEKRELVKTRANQLMSETSRRGQEGDIIGRAIQVMAEHEAVVRAMEETSLAKLAGYMENFEREWMTRSKEFEERKAVFEAEVMQKAFTVLNQHTNTIQGIEHNIREKTMGMLHEQSQSKLALEANLLQQFEVYKAEYRQIFESEYEKRCKLYDTMQEVREAKMMDLLRRERDKLLVLERDAAKQSELYKVQSLGEAMEEISKLKDDLLREHTAQQAVAMQDLMRQRESLRIKEGEAVAKANARVKEMEKQCYDAMQAAQGVVTEMQARLTEQEAVLQRSAAELDSTLESRKQKEIETVKNQMETHWKECIAELRKRHSDEMRKVVDEYQERRDRDLGEQFSREQELRRSYEGRQLKFEDTVEAKWVKHIQELREGAAQQSEIVRELHGEIEGHAARLRDQQVLLSSRENEWALKLITVQREHDAMRATKEAELRTTHDRSIAELVCNPARQPGSDNHVERDEYERVVQDVRAWEVRHVELRRSLEDKATKEREELTALYRARAVEERDGRATWEADVLRKVAELRMELEADTRRKEAEGARRLETERQRLYDEVAQRAIEDRRDREGFERRVNEDSDARYRALQTELNTSYVDQVRSLEKRAEEREGQFETKVRDLRLSTRDFEERVRVAASLSLEREKESLREEMSFIHAKLLEEQAKLTAEKERLHSTYEDMFAQAKATNMTSLMQAVAQQLKYHAVRDEEWARAKQDEMAILIRMRYEYDAIITKRAQDTQRKYEVECLDTVRREKELMDRREVALREELERTRVALEIAARDRAVKLLDERQRILEEAEERRRDAEAEMWAAMEKKIIGKEHEFDERRSLYEVTVKQRFDSLLETERQRVDGLMEEQRREHNVVSERHEASMRMREEEWVRQRMLIEEGERRRREEQYQELRSQCEARVEGERRAKEQEVDRERIRVMTYLEEQMAESNKNTTNRIALLTEDYERRIKSAQTDLQQYREKHIAEVVDAEKHRNDARELFEADTTKRTERALAEMSTMIDKRAVEHGVKEVELREQLEKQRRSHEDRIKTNYERMLKEFEGQLQNTMKEREERAQSLERARGEDLAATVADMEAKHRHHEQEMDNEYRRAVDALRTEFVPKVEGATKALDDERRKRLEAEQLQLKGARELETLRGTMEQWKLDFARTTQQKYDALWSESKAKARREREDHARRLLEDEEKALAKELVRREGDVKRDVADDERSTTVDTQRLHHSERAAKDKANVDTIAQRRAKLYQLWQDLEVSAEDRAQCALRVVDAVATGDLDRAAEELATELRRLESHIPLLDVITRREFVKHKMVEMETAMQHNPSLRVNPLRQKQLEEFARELSRLDEHLLTVLPQLEAKQGPFMYHGRRYLDALEEAHPNHYPPSATGPRQLTSALSAASRITASYRTPGSNASPHSLYALDKQ